MPTVGEMLKYEREVKGIDLADVEKSTNIRVNHLEALERGEYDKLPGDVFTKGFVSAYARFLELDPGKMAGQFLRERGGRALAGPTGGDQVVREMSRILKDRRPARAPSSRSLPLAAAGSAVLVLVIVGLLGLRFGGTAVEPPARTGPAGSLVATRAIEASSETGAAEPVGSIDRDFGADQVERSIAGGSPLSGAIAEPARKLMERPEPIEKPKAVESPKPAEQPAKQMKPTIPDRATRAAPVAPREINNDTPKAAARLSVSGHGVGSRVVSHRLVGESDRFRSGSRVWFWTRVLDGRRGQTIRHVWIHEGRVVNTVRLRLGGDHWRTHSRKSLWESSVGSWAVEARDSTGRVLARSEFVCEPR